MTVNALKETLEAQYQSFVLVVALRNSPLPEHYYALERASAAKLADLLT